MSPDENGWASLSIADRSAASAGYTWYHVMYALGSNPLSGQLPTIAAQLAGPLPIQGSGTFSAQQTSTEMDGACRQHLDDRNVRRHVSRPVRRLGSANC